MKKLSKYIYILLQLIDSLSLIFFQQGIEYCTGFLYNLLNENRKKNFDEQ